MTKELNGAELNTLVINALDDLKAQDVVVLDAVAFEEPAFTIVHQHWKVDDDFVFRNLVTETSG